MGRGRNVVEASHGGEDIAPKGGLEYDVRRLSILAVSLTVAPIAVTVPLLVGTDVVLSASLGLIAILCIALALFRTGQGMLFGATAGGLGIVAGLILATFTAWGIAPPIACSLCGMGAAFLSGPVMRFRSILKQVSGDANEEDAIAHRALSGLFVSLLTLLAILGTTTIVLSLIALNFDLGHLDVAGLTLISVIAIVAATALILAIRSAPEKT